MAQSYCHACPTDEEPGYREAQHWPGSELAPGRGHLQSPVFPASLQTRRHPPCSRNYRDLCLNPASAPAPPQCPWGGVLGKSFHSFDPLSLLSAESGAGAGRLWRGEALSFSQNTGGFYETMLMTILRAIWCAVQCLVVYPYC